MSPPCPTAAHPTHAQAAGCVFVFDFSVSADAGTNVDDVPCWPKLAGGAVFSSAGPLDWFLGEFLFNL